MTISEKLAALRSEMAENHVDAYLVPTDDFHNSEYVGEYFKSRQFISGFTGSAGTALITAGTALLWTDGRYFLQAAEQLDGTGFELMKIGEEGVPTIEAYLEHLLSKGQVLGFDGRCMSAGRGDRFARILQKNGASVNASLDLIGAVWADRPELSCRKVWELDPQYTGKSRAQKLSDLREAMEKKHCSFHIITSLDDIAWLLNLRGDDIPCNPVFLAYAVVTRNEVLLFAQKEAFEGGGHLAPLYSQKTENSQADGSSETLRKHLEADGVRLLPYDGIYRYLSEIPAHSRVLLDSSSVNYTVWTSLGNDVCRIDQTNPTLLWKAVKTPAETGHMRQAHIKDGVAVTKFMYWLKKRMEHYPSRVPSGAEARALRASGKDLPFETEMTCAERLESLRREQEHYIGPSFDTISSWGPHGAVVHYEPTDETDIPLQDHSFLLVDSGGQYLEGTTDITRTFACGQLTQEEKEAYTLVLRGNLNLASAKFKYGCSGTVFDYLARGPLWERGLDYNHGTGHGVGFLLNVHEGPNSFSYKSMQGRRTPCVFEEGMITSDEPGLYFEDRFGVRCENLMLCVKDYKNEYGQFMRFDTLTMVPWDLDAVILDMLTETERNLLNEYHDAVFRTISPFLTEEERIWLRHATRAI